MHRSSKSRDKFTALIRNSAQSKPNTSNQTGSKAVRSNINIPKSRSSKEQSTALKVGTAKRTSFPISHPKKRAKGMEKYEDCQWKSLPYYLLTTICQFCSPNLASVYELSKVCFLWRAHMQSQNGHEFWCHLKQGDNISTFHQLRTRLHSQLRKQQEDMSFEFEKHFVKLFNYGSTKENIPNKLIQKLGLEIEIRLNRGEPTQHPYRLRSFNFSSYLCMKIVAIENYKYDFSTPHNMFKDNIEIEMNFKSRKYRVSHTFKKRYCPEQIVETAVKQKAFNYYLDKNLVFTYFEGDDHFLYIFFEISVLELVDIFRKRIKDKFQDSVSRKLKRVPMHQRLCETEFESFAQYMKFQADFQVHFSYHNSLRQIFTHCNTKVYPVEYDQKEALFHVQIDDSFDRVATYKLDNKMGISESVNDLYLLDFVLKDRDRFLIIFSGFIYARPATQKQRESIKDYFNFSENTIKVIEYHKPSEYSITFLVIEEGGRNLMEKVVVKMDSKMICL